VRCGAHHEYLAHLDPDPKARYARDREDTRSQPSLTLPGALRKFQSYETCRDRRAAAGNIKAALLPSGSRAELRPIDLLRMLRLSGLLAYPPFAERQHVAPRPCDENYHHAKCHQRRNRHHLRW